MPLIFVKIFIFALKTLLSLFMTCSEAALKVPFMSVFSWWPWCPGVTQNFYSSVCKTKVFCCVLVHLVHCIWSHAASCSSPMIWKGSEHWGSLSSKAFTKRTPEQLQKVAKPWDKCVCKDGHCFEGSWWPYDLQYEMLYICTFTLLSIKLLT